MRRRKRLHFAAICHWQARPIAWATRASPIARWRGGPVSAWSRPAAPHWRPLGSGPGPCAKRSADAPADFLGKALVELGLVGTLRRLTHALVKPLRVVANQDAPLPGLDSIENDLGGLRRRGRRVLEKAARAIVGGLLD